MQVEWGARVNRAVVVPCSTCGCVLQRVTKWSLEKGSLDFVSKEHVEFWTAAGRELNGNKHRDQKWICLFYGSNASRQPWRVKVYM